jgi:hypothetical protein
MSERSSNYAIVIILMIIFFLSTLAIATVYTETDANNDLANLELIKKKEEIRTHFRFILPFLSMASFFICCYYIARMIVQGENKDPQVDKFSGIYFMISVAILLSISNFTVLRENKIKEYIKGKKFSTIGVLMALGVSAIVFGFLDNFGMKLGTEALDDSFVYAFLGPFSVDNRFKDKDQQQSIRSNLERLNKWANGKWRSVINHLLRYRDSIKKATEQKILDPILLNRIDKFILEDEAEPLQIPESVNNMGPEAVQNFIQSIKKKYDIIDGSKAMMGNTFSDFMGAIIGAAIINLFVYMTSYDGIYTGDDNIDNSFLKKNLNLIAPFMEAFFIAFGCLVPVFLNIAMTRDPNNSNNRNSWIIVGVIALITTIMMALSVYGIKEMTLNDKKNSIKKTLKDLKQRLDINNKKPDEIDLSLEVDTFLERLN